MKEVWHAVIFHRRGDRLAVNHAGRLGSANRPQSAGWCRQPASRTSAFPCCRTEGTIFRPSTAGPPITRAYATPQLHASSVTTSRYSHLSRSRKHTKIICAQSWKIPCGSSAEFEPPATRCSISDPHAPRCSFRTRNRDSQKAAVGARRQRRVPINSRSQPMRNAALYVHAVKPWT